MSKRFIITEEEKNNIKSLYSIFIYKLIEKIQEIKEKI
jgi:hypothetical protein